MIVVQRADVFSREHVAAGGRPVQASEQVQHGALARPACAHDRTEEAAVDHHGDSGERVHRLASHDVCFANIVQLDDGIRIVWFHAIRADAGRRPRLRRGIAVAFVPAFAPVPRGSCSSCALPTCLRIFSRSSGVAFWNRDLAPPPPPPASGDLRCVSVPAAASPGLEAGDCGCPEESLGATAGCAEVAESAEASEVAGAPPSWSCAAGWAPNSSAASGGANKTVSPCFNPSVT